MADVRGRWIGVGRAGWTAAAVLGAWLLVAACSAPPPESTVPIVPETTRVADAATLAALDAYDPDTGTLRFAHETQALRDLRLDDVFVAEPSAAAPHGLLRRVHAITRDGDAVVVETSQANITDAIHQGALDVTGTFTADDMLEPTLHAEGVTVRAVAIDERDGLARRFAEGDWASFDDLERAQGTGAGYAFHVGLDQVLLDVDVEGVRIRLHVTGEVTFNAGYRLGLNVGPCWELPPVCLRSFEASLGVEQLARMRVTGEASAALNVEKLVASIPFAPIVVLIGPVPVVFVPSVDVYVGGSGEVRLQLTYGVTERFAALVGARWTPANGWRDITEFGLSVDGYDQIDVNASFKASLYVKPEGKILLYGVVGPTLTLAAGIEVDAFIPRNPVWRVTPFLRGSLAFVIEVPVLGRLAGYSTELFEHRLPENRAPNTPPEITLRQTRLRVPMRAEVDLRNAYTVRDREDPFVSVSLRSSRAGDTVSHGSPSRFPSVGVRTVTIEATDSQGARSSRTLEVDVYNPPPAVFASVTQTSIRQSQVPPGFLIPLTLAVGAIDPIDGRLPCSAIDVFVPPPHTVTGPSDVGGGACEAVAHFYEQGPTQVSAFATDADGVRSPTRSYAVTVLPPPLNPPPRIDSRIMIDGDARPAGYRFTCWNGGPFRFTVLASDPMGSNLTYTWTLRHYDLYAASPVEVLVPPYLAEEWVDFPSVAGPTGPLGVNPIPAWAPPGDGAGGPWTVAVSVDNGETAMSASTVFSFAVGRPCVN